MSYKNNKFKISAPKWNGEFEFSDGSYLHQTFKIILDTYLKKHGEKAVNPSIRICISKTENRNMFEIKAETSNF